MSRYTAITTDIWNDREFRQLSPTGKILYIYILTNPQVNQAGFYRLSADAVSFALGKKAGTELQKGSSLYKYDADNEVVLVPNYLKYNIARSNQQIAGVARSVASLPYCDLMVEFLIALLKYSGSGALSKIDKPIRDYATRRALEMNTLESNNLAFELQSLC